MQRLELTELAREVLASIEDLPEGFLEQFMELLNSAPTTRARRLQELVEQVCGG